MSPQEIVEELRAVRPDLVQPYLAALDGARSTVLGRLWGAFAREPLPGIVRRHRRGDTLEVTVAGGRLTGPASAAARFAEVPADFQVMTPDGPLDHPPQLLAALGRSSPSVRRLVHELGNSVVNLALARAAADRNRVAINDSLDAEQAVIDGHPQHPCSRTRTGLSLREVLAYAPEHHPVVDLPLVAVSAGSWQQSGSWPEALRDGGTVLVPVHPWQHEHVLGTYPGIATTPHTIAARPLLSLRTLAPRDTLPGYHFKTSLDVQITSRRRTISPAEIADGPVLSEMLAEIVDAAGYSEDLRLLHEVGGGAARIDGRSCPSLAAVVREAGEAGLAPGEIAVPLTAIYATEAVWVAGDPVSWLAEFAELVLPPTLTLLSLGIGLEAHGQNTLVVLRDGRPNRVLYRDFDGVRLNPDRLAAGGIALPPLVGDRAGKDVHALRTKLFGALLSGVFSEMTAVLSRTRHVEAEALWAQVATTAEGVFAALPANGDAEAFFGETWPLKATTAMRLAPDPRPAQWTPIPNPVRSHRRLGKTRVRVIADGQQTAPGCGAAGRDRA